MTAWGQVNDIRVQFSCWHPDIPGVWRQKKSLGGVNDFMLTVWSDDGAECLYYSVLPTIARLAEKNLQGANGLLKKLTDYSYNEWMALDMPNKLYNGDKALQSWKR